MIRLLNDQRTIFVVLLIITAMTTTGLYYALNWPLALFKQAEQKLSHQEFSEAIILYRQAIERGITNPLAYIHLADAYTAEGKFEEAAIWYRYYLEQYPQDRYVRLLLARVLSYLGKFQESIKEYRTAMEEPYEETDNNIPINDPSLNYTHDSF